MRHLTRLYFDNVSIPGAKDLFISVVDQGVDKHGNALYAVMPHPLSMPMTLTEQFQALRYLQATGCFFKLPVGASAIVDIYVPIIVGSSDPKTFDYQVFKGKAPRPDTEGVLNALKALSTTYEPLLAQAQNQSAGTQGTGTEGPAGPLVGLVGISGASCMNSNTGPSVPCGNQHSIPCNDPLLERALCIDEELLCVDHTFSPKKP